MYERGAVWLAELPGVGRNPVLIISSRAVTLSLRPIVVRITSVERERAIATTVPLVAGELDGLPDPSQVICHDLFTLPDGVLREHVGRLSPTRMVEVERAVAVALALD